MPESLSQLGRPKTLKQARRSSELEARKQSPDPNKIPSERNSLVRAAADALSQALSSGRRLRDSDRKTVLPVRLVFDPACSHLAHSNPWARSAPTQQARGYADSGAATKVLRMRRPPASTLVTLEKGATLIGERWDRHRRRFRTH